jgi:hypothetical protein
MRFILISLTLLLLLLLLSCKKKEEEVLIKKGDLYVSFDIRDEFGEYVNDNNGDAVITLEKDNQQIVKNIVWYNTFKDLIYGEYVVNIEKEGFYFTSTLPRFDSIIKITHDENTEKVGLRFYLQEKVKTPIESASLKQIDWHIWIKTDFNSSLSKFPSVIFFFNKNELADSINYFYADVKSPQSNSSEYYYYVENLMNAYDLNPGDIIYVTAYSISRGGYGYYDTLNKKNQDVYPGISTTKINNLSFVIPTTY